MKWVVSILFVVGAAGVLAQGTFQNLDFEMGNPGPGPGRIVNNVPIANALPFWSVSYGSTPQSTINFNDPSTGATEVTLFGSPDFTIDGKYSVLLQGTVQAATLSQTSIIPANAQALYFEANGSAPMGLFVGGQDVPYSTISTSPNFNLYGANISAWSGETESLTFRVFAGGNVGGEFLDDISFSPNPITVTPEPDAVTLMGIGGALFAAYRRFAPKRK